MKPLEIISLIPKWAEASPDEILSSPAWAMPCRFGTDACTLRMCDIRPSDTIDLSVRFENEQHVLRLAKSPRLKELGSIWQSLSDVPEPVVLALVEKDCAPLFQLLENAVRKQFKVLGIIPRDDIEDVTEEIYANLCENGATTLSFALSKSPAIVSALGLLRYIDVSHPSVRETFLPAEVQYASFTLHSGELSSFAEGDALLMPEVGSLAPSLIVDGRFLAAEGGVTQWKDEGLLRIVSADPASVSLGELLDGKPAIPGAPAAAAQLRLVRLGRVVAYGRLGSVGSHPAFICERAETAL